MNRDQCMTGALMCAVEATKALAAAVSAKVRHDLVAKAHVQRAKEHLLDAAELCQKTIDKW